MLELVSCPLYVIHALSDTYKVIYAHTLYKFKKVLGRHSNLWLELSPHSQKVLGSIPSRGKTFLCFHVLPVFVWLCRCISSQYPRPRHWLRVCGWSPGAALWLPTAPQGWVKCREHVSLYTVYM